MVEKRYKIMFDGKIRKGREIDDVKRDLAARLKMSPEKIDRLFSGKPIVIRKNVDEESARKIRKIFEKAGAVLLIQPTDKQISSAKPSGADKTPPSSPDLPVIEENKGGLIHSQTSTGDKGVRIKPKKLNVNVTTKSRMRAQKISMSFFFIACVAGSLAVIAFLYMVFFGPNKPLGYTVSFEDGSKVDSRVDWEKSPIWVNVFLIGGGITGFLAFAIACNTEGKNYGGIHSISGECDFDDFIWAIVHSPYSKKFVVLPVKYVSNGRRWEFLPTRAILKEASLSAKESIAIIVANPSRKLKKGLELSGWPQAERQSDMIELFIEVSRLQRYWKLILVLIVLSIMAILGVIAYLIDTY